MPGSATFGKARKKAKRVKKAKKSEKSRKRVKKSQTEWKSLFPSFLYAAGLCDTGFKGCTKNERKREREWRKCEWVREREAPPVAAVAAAHSPLLIAVKKKKKVSRRKKTHIDCRLAATPHFFPPFQQMVDEHSRGKKKREPRTFLIQNFEDSFFTFISIISQEARG